MAVYPVTYESILACFIHSYACLRSNRMLSCQDTLFVENRVMIIRTSHDFTSNYCDKVSQHGMDRQS